MKGAVSLDGLPPADRAEAAFAGRSNVGKSSLINALTGRKNLARASNTPGRTQELNFFDLGDSLRLVDLPGYGFAAAPKQAAARWKRLTRDYLRGRANLKRVYLLVDARHGIKPLDEDVMAALDSAAVSYQIVLTKADKLKTGELDQRLAETAETVRKRPAAHPEVLVTSSEKNTGLEALRAAIAALTP
ncbi:MAG: ribosome biogenesis GTP-binding protein YihA/YsxC [Maricaulaceae bacterium]|nr:ribosome biogenesis GTP-binding protein YihA/YsxC [Maricaulaceae bacterium]